MALVLPQTKVDVYHRLALTFIRKEGDFNFNIELVDYLERL